MKLVKVYLFGELQNTARDRVEGGAFMYACNMMLQGKDCPPHLYPTAFQTFKDEFLGGYFSADGLARVQGTMLTGAEDRGNVPAPDVPVTPPKTEATPGAGEDGPPSATQ